MRFANTAELAKGAILIAPNETFSEMRCAYGIPLTRHTC